jgi:hypothetical protein
MFTHQQIVHRRLRKSQELLCHRFRVEQWYAVNPYQAFCVHLDVSLKRLDHQIVPTSRLHSLGSRRR